MTHRPDLTGDRTRRRPLLALGALLGALLYVVSGAALGVAQAAPGEDGWIRVGHLSPGTPKAEVRLTPFDGGATTVVGDAAYGQLSAYQRVPAGLYTVTLARADQPEAAAMLTRNVEVTAGTARTVIATGAGEDARATVLEDDLTAPPAGQAKVRLVSAVTDAPAVSATAVGGPSLARDLRSGEAGAYADVDARTWGVELSAQGLPTADGEVVADAGSAYTLIALDGADGTLQLQAVQDTVGSATAGGDAPRGGVDAGAGGLAAGGAGSLGPVGSALAGVALLGAVGALALVTRRPTRA